MVNGEKRRRPGTRRLVQLYSALLYNAHLKGFITGQIYQGAAKAACVPGFNCYSCPGAVGACPLGAIQNALAASGHRAGWYVLGILLLYGVMLGRTVCGWLCPLGLAQELAHRIPTPKLRKSPVTRALSRLKYVVLAVFVVALPLWYGLRYDLPLPAFCKYICPAGTSEGAMALLAHPANAGYFSMLGALFTRKFVIMLAIGLACIFCYRAFCRFLCPLGAIYGLFNRFNIVGTAVDPARCNGCGACVRGCGMDVRRVGDAECIQCGKCMASCARGAIAIKAGRVTLKAPETESAGDAPQKRKRLARLLWAAALALLCFALVWFNALDPTVRREAANETGTEAVTMEAAETESSTTEASNAESSTTEASTMEASAVDSSAEAFVSDAPEGNGVGKRLPDFALTCYDGTVFRLSEQRGRITFINIWATYCTPCKQELPWFSALYEAHAGDIAMLAIHPSLLTDDPEAYLADKGYAMPFATDPDDGVVGLLGGTGVLPQTVVLNRRGEVVYNAVGSVTPELLEALYARAGE